MDTPLLPPWATEEDVESVMTDLMFEIRNYRAAFDQLAAKAGTQLVSEADAYLTRIADGW